MHTYNVGFEDVGGEGQRVRNTPISPRSVSVRCMNVVLCPKPNCCRLPEAIEAMSEPMVSHDCIGFYLLSEAVRATARWCRAGRRRRKCSAATTGIRPCRAAPSLQDYLAAFRDRDHAEYAQTVQPQYLTGDCSADWVQAHFAGAGADDPVERPCAWTRP